MATKSVYFVGNEEGSVYAPTPNMIYVRERFIESRYEITHTVEVPERYRSVTFRHGELVFVVFEGDKGYVNGKDFRSHISESSSDANSADDVIVTDTGSWIYGTFTVEDESLHTTADDKGKTLLERWERDNDQT